MSAEAYREEEMYSEVEPNIVNIKRNPYLVDYEQRRRQREYRVQGMSQGQRAQRTSQRVQEEVWEQEVRRAPQRRPQQDLETGRVPRRRPQQGQETGRVPQRRPQQSQEMGRVPQRRPQQDQEMRRVPQRRPQQGQEMERAVQRRPQQGQEMGRAPQRRPQQSQEMRRTRAEIEKRRAAVRRRRIVRMQRMVLFSGVFCIALLCGILYMKRIDVKAEEPDIKGNQTNETSVISSAASTSGVIQGLSATEFAKHPEWEENFLTPNEYSRPGEALEEVNSIFVHYTANPNTSAAQNRSYFEQLKDTHITSASAHFIIGYNGEIIQCIPLDEIAYAVQTRNYDSVSIECCYKSADGSFTQETYDSLIELLAWLTDVYDLTTDDILRHYDCGRKKCPIYYTEHEDAWERLKEDVGEKL